MPNPDDVYKFADLSESFRRVLVGVLEYVVRNPDAKDTVGGIRKWWHQPGSAEWPLAELEQALAFCAARDWIMVRDLAQGVRVYGPNPRQLGEIERFLSQA